MIAMTIYSRPGCHLCEEMKATIGRVLRRNDSDARLEEIDISTDAQLEARYGAEIPVLLVNGKKAAKFRVSEWELERLVLSQADRS